MVIIIDEDVQAELDNITEESDQHYPIVVYKRVELELTVAQCNALADKTVNCSTRILSAQLTYNLSKYFV